MFEKLFLLVKNNAGTAVTNNPAIARKTPRCGYERRNRVRSLK
jgi:hypothetical protein